MSRFMSDTANPPEKKRLFGWLRKAPAQQQAASADEPPAAPEKTSLLARLRQGLAKTRAGLGEGMADLLLGKKAIDDELLEEIENRLLAAIYAGRL